MAQYTVWTSGKEEEVKENQMHKKGSNIDVQYIVL